MLRFIPSLRSSLLVIGVPWNIHAAAERQSWRCWLFLCCGRIVQEHDFPISISFEEHIGLLVVFVGNFSVLQFRADMQEIAGDSAVLVRTHLDMHVGELNFLDSVPLSDVGGPILARLSQTDGLETGAG